MPRSGSLRRIGLGASESTQEKPVQTAWIIIDGASPKLGCSDRFHKQPAAPDMYRLEAFMLKRGAVIVVVAVVLAAAVFIGVKAEVIHPNMVFVPEGVKGVDVSEHQGTIDFEALSRENIEFVYAKATEGATHVDSQFATTCGQASNSRISLGAYHFFSFDSPGATQAENFAASAKRSWDDPTIRALRPAVDVEWYGDKKQNPPQAEDVRRELKAFLEAVEAACGHKPLIYACNPSGFASVCSAS